jgi:N-dimethylarginine dimethylaminohydrolase
MWDTFSAISGPSCKDDDPTTCCQRHASQTGGGVKVLMCAPSHYDIRYEINPWMKLHNRIRTEKALVQWEELRRALARLGVQVLTLPQKKECPDMVFTANAGVVKGRDFIPSHFRYRERRAEEGAFTRFFKRRGYRIRDAAKNMCFEGEGDLLPYGDMLFGGFRFRSEIKAHERVSEVLQKRLVTLDLVQPHFYHLDTCFLPLDYRSALYYPSAFDAYGRKVIERFIKNPIPVSTVDAFQFACNGIRVGRTVVLNKASRALKNRLKKEGYDVLETPTTEFMKAGGSVKCLLLKL